MAMTVKPRITFIAYSFFSGYTKLGFHEPDHTSA
ncbi:hypothetical protein FHX03_006626 [Rhizobium sp. BK456]|nr:hypothetical protein [Rhizobium sp. BK456]